MLGDTNLHLSGGRTQYEYMEFVLEKMGGQGRKCLDTQLLMWNWKLDEDQNPNLTRAIAREKDRALWRIYYGEKAVFTMRKVQFCTPGPAPIRPDDAELVEVPSWSPQTWKISTPPSKASSPMRAPTT